MVVDDLEAASHGQDDPSTWQGTCSSWAAKIKMVYFPGWSVVRKIVFSCCVAVREVPGLSKYSTASATYVPEFLCYIAFHFPKPGLLAAGKSEFFRKLEWVRGGLEESRTPHNLLWAQVRKRTEKRMVSVMEKHRLNVFYVGRGL